MTTDYSAYSNADKLRALIAEYNDWEESTPEDSLPEAFYPYLVVYRLAEIILSDLDAARAEAQRLREQRDALVEYAETWLTFHSGPELFSIRRLREILATIAAEDGVQGGE